MPGVAAWGWCTPGVCFALLRAGLCHFLQWGTCAWVPKHKLALLWLTA